MNLAKRIRDCRYAKGWGPDELASRAAISRTALYQIECGKTETPRAGTLRRIAQALGMSIETLLDGRDPHEWEGFGSEATPFAPEEPGGDHRDLATHRFNTPHFMPRGMTSLDRDLERKLCELLASPLGESVARIVEESYRLLPARDAG